MPSAGALVPPLIFPLRDPRGSQQANKIDNATFIQLKTDSPYCKVYFTTDGTKPSPFQRKVAGKESTFKYKAPFTLKPGRRVLKAIAVSRDKILESAVVSKTFVVDEVDLTVDSGDEKCNGRRPLSAQRNGRPRSRRKLAWEEKDERPATRAEAPAGTDNNNRPFAATNYSGTQINLWGVPPENISGLLADPNVADFSKVGLNGVRANPYAMTPYGWQPAQQQPTANIGLLAQQMMQKLDVDRANTMSDIRSAIKEQIDSLPLALPAPPASQDPPTAAAESPGPGDWTGVVKHIYAHLAALARSDADLRQTLNSVKLGRGVSAELVADRSPDQVVLKLTMKRLSGAAKPKMVKAATLPTAPIAEPPAPKPSPPVSAKKAPAAVVESKPTADKPAPPPAVVKPAQPAEPTPQTSAPVVEKDKVYYVTEPGQTMTGTVKEAPNFNANTDAEALRKAMKGLGTDEKAIINVLGRRSCAQRLEIKRTFKQSFGKDLSGEIHSETSGNFRKMLEGLLLSLTEYDAHCLHEAVAGLGTNEDCLIEIICTRSDDQLKAVTASYKEMYNKELEKDISGDTSGWFRRLLVSLLQANRDPSREFNPALVTQDADALYAAGPKKWGTDESEFNKVLCQRSYAHLRALFQEYEHKYGKSLIKVIDSEMSGDIRKAMTTIVKVVTDRVAYFAEALYLSMKGLGTNDFTLQRIVITRCELDMVQIKEAFQRAYNQSLAQWIQGDTSGDYCKLLLTLIGDA